MIFEILFYASLLSFILSVLSILIIIVIDNNYKEIRNAEKIINKLVTTYITSLILSFVFAIFMSI